MTSGFAFTYGPSLRCGAGSTAQMAELLPPGPVLFVTDKQLLAHGLADVALAALQESGRSVSIFDSVEPDPSDATVLKAVAQGRDAGASAVVGFGGGSPMDVAKVAAYLLANDEPLEAIYGVGNATGLAAPLILCPTTAGTGSEATPIAILTTGDGRKLGIVSPSLYAQWALLDPNLTISLPPPITAATGIDAIVHAIEAYTSARLKNSISDMLARQALQLLAGNLRKVIADGQDLAAREAMLLGSHLAGVAFSNAPVAAVHALAYPLGGIFHVPHGLSNALMLCHVLRFNMPAAERAYAELAPLVDPKLAALEQGARAQAFVSALSQLITDIGLPDKLSAMGIGAEHLDLLAEEAMLQTRLLINNPRSMERDQVRALYEAAL